MPRRKRRYGPISRRRNVALPITRKCVLTKRHVDRSIERSGSSGVLRSPGEPKIPCPDTAPAIARIQASRAAPGWLSLRTRSRSDGSARAHDRLRREGVAPRPRPVAIARAELRQSRRAPASLLLSRESNGDDPRSSHAIPPAQIRIGAGSDRRPALSLGVTPRGFGSGPCCLPERASKPSSHWPRASNPSG